MVRLAAQQSAGWGVGPAASKEPSMPPVQAAGSPTCEDLPGGSIPCSRCKARVVAAAEATGSQVASEAPVHTPLASLGQQYSAPAAATTTAAAAAAVGTSAAFTCCHLASVPAMARLAHEPPGNKLAWAAGSRPTQPAGCRDGCKGHDGSACKQLKGWCSAARSAAGCSVASPCQPTSYVSG
jgi:hypothetical protein